MSASHHAVTVMTPELFRLDWTSLEAPAKLAFTESQRADFLKSLNRYIEHVAYQQARPLEKGVKRRLAGIEAHARKLAALLSPYKKDRQGRQVLALEELEAALVAAFPFSLADPATLKYLLHVLATSAYAACTYSHGTPGRPPHEGLPTFIRSSHAIFRAAGGIGRGCSWSEQADPPQFTGPFLDLLDAACDQAASPLGHTSLAQAIRIPRTTLALAIKDAF